MRISSAGKGRITSRGSGSSLSQWAQSPGARITGIRSANMASKRAFRIGRSRTGLGRFSPTPIKKKAFIVEYNGRKLTTKQADKLEARGNRYLCEINSRWTIDGTSRKNLARYANHSCRPNAEAHTIGHKVIIRAIKNIGTGAEITYNYSRDYLINVITRRGCQCDKCRKRRADVHSLATIRDAIQQTNAIILAACGSDERPCPVLAGSRYPHMNYVLSILIIAVLTAQTMI